MILYTVRETAELTGLTTSRINQLIKSIPLAEKREWIEETRTTKRLITEKGLHKIMERGTK